MPAGSHTHHQLPDHRNQNNIQGHKQSMQYVQDPALLATDEDQCHQHHHRRRGRYQGYTENDDCDSRGCGHIVDNAKSWRPLAPTKPAVQLTAQVSKAKNQRIIIPITNSCLRHASAILPRDICVFFNSDDHCQRHNGPRVLTLCLKVSLHLVFISAVENPGSVVSQVIFHSWFGIRCICSKSGHQIEALALVTNLATGGATCFGVLALVTYSATTWGHLH